MLKVTAILVIALLLVQKKLNSHQIGTGLNPTRVDCSSCISGHASGDARHQGDPTGQGYDPLVFYAIEYDIKKPYLAF